MFSLFSLTPELRTKETIRPLAFLVNLMFFACKHVLWSYFHQVPPTYIVSSLSLVLSWRSHNPRTCLIVEITDVIRINKLYSFKYDLLYTVVDKGIMNIKDPL